MDLTKGEISQHVKDIALPASLGFFFNTMFNVVDTYFAGWISTDALAAMTISFPVYFIIIAFVQGLSTGATALIAHALGSKNKHLVERTSVQVIAFSIVTYLVVAPLGMLASRYLFVILGASGQYLDMAEAYMDVIFAGSIFFVLLYGSNSILQAHGNARVLKNFLVGGFFLNAALNPLFLFGGFGIPAMGIRGIALATVVTLAVGFLYVIGQVIKGGYLQNAKPRDFIPRSSSFLEIAEQSIPASLNMMTIGIGIFVINYFIKGFGREAVAMYGIGTRIEQITLLPTIGLTTAAITIAGQNTGAKMFSRVQKTLHISLKYGSVISLFGCLMMLLFPGPLFRIFSSDHTVQDLGVPYLRIAAISSWAYMILVIHIATLQGMKHPYYALFIGFMRQILVPIVVFYLATMVFHLGLISIWWSICLITWSAAIATIFYTRHIIKKKL